jgi:hypothetical protein
MPKSPGYSFTARLKETGCPAKKMSFFGQNCSLPFSLRSLDIPALLKSWQKH